MDEGKKMVQTQMDMVQLRFQCMKHSEFRALIVF